MDDNNQNSQGNQPPINAEGSKPIFETVTVETPASNEAPVDLQPEEVAPDIVNTSDVAKGGVNPEVIASDQPLVYEESKSKYIIMAVGGIFFIIIAVFIFFFLLNSLKKGGVGTKKETILTYWGLWEDKEIMDPIIAQYEQKNPGIKIQYEKKTPEQYREKLIVRTIKGQGPDIFRFHNTWLPELRDEQTKQFIPAPIPGEIMTNAEFEKTFYPIHQKDLKMGTKYYGLPLYVDGLVLVYNDSLFRKAGLNTGPANWDELIEDVGKIQVQGKDGEIITAGIAMGTTSNIEHFSDIFGLVLLLNGGDIASLDSTEASGALEAYRRFAEPPNNTWNESMPNAIAAFVQQKVAMIIVPSWELFTIKTADPDLKIKVIPIPKPPGGKQVSLASYWVEGVSSMSTHQLEAWKFVKFLTQKDTMTKLYELQSATRLFGEPYSRVDLADLLIPNEYIGPVIKQAQDDVYVSLPLSSNTFDAGLNDENIRYIQNAINASVKGVSYSEALQTAKKGIDQVILRYKIQ